MDDPLLLIINRITAHSVSLREAQRLADEAAKADETAKARLKERTKQMESLMKELTEAMKDRG